MLQALSQQSTAAGTAAGTAGSAVGRRQLQLQVLAMPDDTLVNRIVAQTAAQPGGQSENKLCATCREANSACAV